MRVSNGLLVLPLSLGGGDNLQQFVPTTAQVMLASIGTAAAPDTTTNPTVKVNRTISLLVGQVTGDGAEQAAAFSALASGTATNQVQPVGVRGGADNAGSSDATGVYGEGRSTGTGKGIGGFFNGQALSPTCQPSNGAQVNVKNNTGADWNVNAAGFSGGGIWLTTNGSNLGGAAIEIGNGFGQQFDVGLHANSTISGGFTGGVKSAFVRDDSTAATSILINGTHAAAAIAVAAGAGPTLLGGTAAQQSNSLLEVQAPNANRPFLAWFGSTAFTNAYQVGIGNPSGTGSLFVSGGSGQVLTGSAAGDVGLTTRTAGKRVLLGGSGIVVSVTQGNALGFFGAAEQTKQTVTGSKGGNAALASLMTALAAYGIVTDTTT
ncbi:MAG TPA: hypothetical protein VFC09_09810 [Candidatus Dormibacteraeota bacterium]|nr:hypothetical protein [Candidatus Dormibacteraeota bacterium]